MTYASAALVLAAGDNAAVVQKTGGSGQKSASFQAVKYSYVMKTILSPVPSEFFLSPELKLLKAKFDTAGGGNRGSPQEMLLVDDVVYDYWFGARNAEEIEAKIAAIVAGGTAYPGERCTVRMKGWNCASKN